MSETQMQHHQRRRAVLAKLRKAELCSLYRRMGGMGGMYPPEQWRKDEVITAITEIEWSRLPEDQKAPTPPLMSPPCDECGGGQDATAHGHDGDHNYAYTHDPDVTWVRADHEPAEEQPTEANATAELKIASALVAIDMVKHLIAPPDPLAAMADPATAETALAVYEIHRAGPIDHGPPVVLEGGTGPGVSPDQTRETPDVIPPALAVAPFRPCEDCRTPITCEESEEDRCP